MRKFQVSGQGRDLLGCKGWGFSVLVPPLTLHMQAGMAGRSPQDCTEISALLGPEGPDLHKPACQAMHQVWLKEEGEGMTLDLVPNPPPSH